MMMRGREISRVGLITRRWHSSWIAKDIPRFGYEFSKYIQSDIDSTICERSLTKGTKLFYGSSMQCRPQFERLFETAAIDEIDLTPMMIGCSLPPQSTNTNPIENIRSLTHAMFNRPLDFITIPYENDQTLSTLLDQIKQSALSPTSGLGIELGTGLLLKTTSSSTLIDRLQSLHQRKLLDMIVMAANPYTNYIIQPILSWAKSQGIVTIACDIFRGHPQSPGLMLPPSVSRQRKTPLQGVPMNDAIEQFRKCLDACVQMEKIYVEKLPIKSKEVFDQLKPIFLGFSITNSQHQILFMEEWDYIKDNQINPAYEKAIPAFQKLSTESSEFVRLHATLRRNLIRSFETVLFVRQESLTSEAHQDGLKAVEQRYSHNPLTAYPFHEALLKSWKVTGFDFVLSTGVEIFADQWNQDMTTLQKQDSVEKIADRYLETVLGPVRPWEKEVSQISLEEF